MFGQVIIRKHRVRIKTTDLDEAFLLQKYYEENLHEDIVTMMERVFNNIPWAEQYYEINKLEIQLGKIDTQEFESHFVKLVEAKLLLELQKKITLENQGSVIPKMNVLGGSEQSTPAMGNSPDIEKIWYFFLHGFFPWWVKKEEQLHPSELLTQLSSSDLNILLLKFLVAHKEETNQINRNTISRLFIYLSALQQDLYLEQLAALINDGKIIRNIQYLIECRESLLEQFEISKEKYNFLLFNHLLERSESADLFMVHFIQQLQTSAKISLQEWKRKLGKIPEMNRDDFKASLGELLSTETNTTQEIKQPLSENKVVFATKEVIDEEGIYINNAGLVLVNPFLTTLFSKCGLLNESGQIRSAECRHKGAVLLYYLQCGNDQYKEWEMPLNKLLCGMAPEDLLPNGIEITEEEKEECRELLKAVVEHWTVLKSSSVEALQYTFLLRDGKISKRDDKCYLIVERTGVDVLLDGIPWGFHTIKLAWLDHIIYVEW